MVDQRRESGLYSRHDFLMSSQANCPLNGRPAVAVKSPMDDLHDALVRDDEAALRALLPALRERLARLAKQRLPEASAEDVVQETLETLWRRRDQLRDAGHVLPFVFQVLRNKIGNAYQRLDRQRATERPERDCPDNPGPAHAHPYRIVAGAQLERILREAIDRCAAEHELWGRVLRFLSEGKSPAEIHSALGDVPMATVHTRIHRARQRLKEILARDFGVDLDAAGGDGA